MSHDLVLQTKIGREETLEKFLHTIGKKGTIKDPCAVRLRRVNREEFEARWAQKARALQIDANWIEPGLKLKNFKLFATDMDSTFLNLETLDEMASFVGKGEEVAHITGVNIQYVPGEDLKTIFGTLEFQPVASRAAQAAALRAEKEGKTVADLLKSKNEPEV